MRRALGPLHLKLIAAAFSALILAGAATAQIGGPAPSNAPLSLVLGQPRSVQVVKPYGMVSDSVSIVAPPGRRGVEPHLSLNYSSGNGDGVLGVGWDLTVGYVEQDIRNGLPAAVQSDTYNFQIAGLAGEIYNTGNGVYRSHTEQVYRTFEQTSNGGWTMQDGQGNQYTFGSTAASRVGTGLWMLDSVSDASGNNITYTYLNDEGALYPETINYTGFGSSPGANELKFLYGARPDVHESWIHGVSEIHELRLTSIEAYTLVPTQQLVRAYQMTYQQTAIGESVLSQVTLVGDDNHSTIPLRTMTYSNLAQGWNPAQGATSFDSRIKFNGWEGADVGTRMLDLDGDGCADLILSEVTDLILSEVIYLGDCTGNFNNRAAESALWNNAFNSIPTPQIATAVSLPNPNGVGAYQTTEAGGIQFLDVNGDGRPDIVIADPVTNIHKVYLNTYTPGNPSTIGWAEAPPNWTMPLQETSFDAQDGLSNCPALSPTGIGGAVAPPTSTTPFAFNISYAGSDPNQNAVPGAPSGVSFVDVNGDGLPDIVWLVYQDSFDGITYGSSGTAACIAAVYLNTGSGWVKDVALSHQLALLTRRDLSAFTMVDTWLTNWSVQDINGDGMADLVYTDANYAQVMLFNGSSWVEDANYATSLQATGMNSTSPTTQGVPSGLMFYDYSHDGLVDMIYSVQGSAPKAFRNTGTGFQEDPAMEAQLTLLSPLQGPLGDDKVAPTVAMADINGDGIPDLIPVAGDFDEAFATNFYLGGWCPNGNCSTYGNNGQPTGKMLSDGMLTYWVGPLGEEVSLTYDRAPTDLQLPEYVASVLIRSEARSDITTPEFETYTYAYTGGLYTDRKYYGFAQTTEVDPNGNTIVSTNDQRDLFAGQEDSESVYDSSSNLRYQLVNTWTEFTPYQGAQTSKMETFTDPGTGGGAAASYSTVANYTYDQYLNLTSLYRNPNTTQPGTDSTMIYHWASNSAAGIWSLPTAMTEYSGTGTSSRNMLSNTTFFYDNESFGQATRGLLTSQMDTVDVTLPLKSVIKTNTYDQYGNVVAVKDRNGNTSTFTYDSQTSTNRVSATDPDGNILNSTFDPRFGCVLSDTDPSGNTITYQYDAFGRVLEVIKPGDSGLAGGTTNYIYELPAQNVLPVPTGLSVTRRDSMPNGVPLVSIDLYDSYGQVYKKILYNNAKPIVSTTQYDNMGFPITLSRPHFENAAAVYTTLTRDSLHRIIQIQDPAGQITTRSYAGMQVTETDPRGLTTVTTMNPWQKVTSKVLPTASGTATTQYVYDAEHQLNKVIRADGSTSTMTYDLLGRRTSMTDPNAGNFTYQYDNEGHMTAVTGPDGKTIHYTYKPSGALLSRIYPDGTTHTITYGAARQTNAVGRMVSVADAAGTLQFAYDARGRVIQRTRYVTANQKTYVTGYTYDSADHLIALTYPDGFQILYTYDALGNVASVKDNSGNLIAGSFSYSASGRLDGLTYGNGTSSSYTYDVIDRMTGLKTKQSGGPLIQNLAYTYDADSNVSAIIDGLNTDNQMFTYDSMNRLVSAVGQGYGTEAYSYDALGNLLTKGTVAFIMDPAHPEQADCMVPNSPGIATCSQAGNSALPIQYDVHGNMIQVGSSQYAYDPENRLLTESTGGSVSESNIYDFWGDRVVQQTATETRIFIDGIYEENGTTAERHVRTANLLLATIVTSLGETAIKTQVSKHSISVPIHYLVAAPPVGDSRPFMLASTGFSLLVLLLGACFRFSRSAGRLRVRMSSPRFFKPFRSLMNLLLILCFIVSGGQQGSAEISPAKAMAPPAGAMRTVVITKTVTSKTAPGEVRYYYHMNHLGGVNIVTNDSGAVVTVRQYKPYGEMYQNEGTVPVSTLPFSFDGERQDGASSLYYFNARFYNPVLGRFLSPDTEIHNPTVPQALNRYAFAGGNPIRYVDPSGHSWFDFLIAACIIAFILVIAIASGGAGAGLLVLAFGAIGFCVGADVALGTGNSLGSDTFWEEALTGALVGASIGGGLGNVAAEGADAADLADTAKANPESADAFGDSNNEVLPRQGRLNPSTMRSVLADISKSIAFGAPQSVLTHELQGGGTDSLLLDTEIGIGVSAASGAVMGRITSAAGEAIFGPATAQTALRGFGLKLAFTLVVQGSLWTFAGLEHQSLGGYIYGEVKEAGPIVTNAVATGADTYNW